MRIPFASVNMELSVKIKRYGQKRNDPVSMPFRGCDPSAVMPREGGASSTPRNLGASRCRRLLDHPLSRVMTASLVKCAARESESKILAFKLFVGDDLDAEAGQSFVVVHRGSEVADRGDAEIAQDLRADADLAPLPVAVGFGGFFLRQGCHRNAGGAVAQIDQHATAGLLA